MKEETKKIFSASEVGVLIEDFDKKIDLVIEGHTTTREELGRKITAAREEFGQSLGDVETELKFIRLELRLIKAEVTEVRKHLTRKADRERLEELEKRVIALEKALAQRK